MGVRARVPARRVCRGQQGTTPTQRSDQERTGAKRLGLAHAGAGARRGGSGAHLLSAVHVIAEEEVVRLRREATVLKQPQQIIVLPVNIACAVVVRVR